MLIYSVQFLIFSVVIQLAITIKNDSVNFIKYSNNNETVKYFNRKSVKELIKTTKIPIKSIISRNIEKPIRVKHIGNTVDVCKCSQNNLDYLANSEKHIANNNEKAINKNVYIGNKKIKNIAKTKTAQYSVEKNENKIIPNKLENKQQKPNKLAKQKQNILKNNNNSSIVNNNTPMNETDKIVGGIPAKQNRFPSIVAIIVKGVTGAACGGTLIKANFVLTAAHCVKGKTKDQFTIRAGSLYSRKGGYTSKVCDIFINQNFNRRTLNDDIALMKLDPGFKPQLKTKSVSIIQLSNIPANLLYSCTVAGWGVVSEQAVMEPRKLRKLNVKIVGKNKCNKLLNNSLTDSMICATGSLKGGKDHCFGDSGGPLYCNGKVAGIVSWADGCAKPESPGVYTNVYFERNWINNYIG